MRGQIIFSLGFRMWDQFLDNPDCFFALLSWNMTGLNYSKSKQEKKST